MARVVVIEGCAAFPKGWAVVSEHTDPALPDEYLHETPNGLYFQPGWRKAGKITCKVWHGYEGWVEADKAAEAF